MCKDGVDGLNQPITQDCTAGKLVSDLLALNSHAKESVVEYIGLYTLKQKWDKLQEKK